MVSAGLPEGFAIPARIHRVEQTVRRSRFVTVLAHAPDALAARAFLERMREEYPDATHHCWAFVAGPPGNTSSIGMGDDGEPHGTAGRPMLTALLHSGVGEVVAVCARWFGGTKLGTGGLARAYGGGVKEALAALPTLTKVLRDRFRVEVEYAHLDAVRRICDDLDVHVEAEHFGASVTVRVAVGRQARDAFEAGLSDATGGRASLRSE